LRTVASNLQINVAHLLKSPSGSNTSYRIDEYIGKDEIDYIYGDIILTRSGHGIMVNGKMTANTVGTCNRCLKNINYIVKFDIEEEFLPEAYTSSRKTEIGAFDTSAIINGDNILDLSEVVRQYALISIPIKLLCNPDCIGLCATCGRDLNEGPCKCSINVNLESAINVINASYNIERRTPSNGTTA